MIGKALAFMAATLGLGAALYLVFLFIFGPPTDPDEFIHDAGWFLVGGCLAVAAAVVSIGQRLFLR